MSRIQPIMGATWVRPTNPTDTDNDTGASLAVAPSGDVLLSYWDASSKEIRLRRSTDGASTFATPVKVGPTLASGQWKIDNYGGRSIDANSSIDVDRSGGTHNGNVYVVWNDHLAPPSGPPPLFSATGGSLPRGNYVVAYTYVYSGGESPASPGANVSLGTGEDALQIGGLSSIPNGVISIRFYLTGTPIGSGLGAGYIGSTAVVGGSAQGFLVTSGGNSQLPPVGGTHIFFARSLDGGQTFPMVSRLDTANRNDAWEPTLSVDQSNGSVAVAWYDRRGDPNNTLYHVYYTHSTDGGASFLPQQMALSTGPGADPSTNQVGTGDYMAMVAVGGVAHPVWAENVATSNMTIWTAPVTDSQPTSSQPQGRCTNTIAAGGAHTVAIQADGTLKAWGVNEAGDLGSGSFSATSGPVSVVGVGGLGVLSNVVSTATGMYDSLALDSHGSVWGWGDDTYGQIGAAAATSGCTASPVPLLGLPPSVVTIGAGQTFSTAVDSAGSVWAWGDNEHGQLGNGAHQGPGSLPGGSPVPVHVVGPSGTGNLTNVVAVTGGAKDSYALKSDGSVWAWGWNKFGELGNNSNSESDSPVQVQGLTGVTITAIAADGYSAYGLDTEGRIWAWGFNAEGELGDGTTTDSWLPTRSGSAVDLRVQAIAAHMGDHVLALDLAHNVWSWGLGGHGQLGNGLDDWNPEPDPQLAGISGIESLAAEGGQSVVLSENGGLWEWGTDGLSGVGPGLVNSAIPLAISGAVGLVPGRLCASN